MGCDSAATAPVALEIGTMGPSLQKLLFGQHMLPAVSVILLKHRGGTQRAPLFDKAGPVTCVFSLGTAEPQPFSCEQVRVLRQCSHEPSHVLPHTVICIPSAPIRVRPSMSLPV